MAALSVLLLLDGHRKMRRLFSRAFLLAVVSILTGGLLVMVVSSLLALRQVTRSVESLIGGSMARLEMSVSMRSSVRETQLDLLRLRVGQGQRLDTTEARRFEKTITDLLHSYRAGIREEADNANADRIASRLGIYMAALQPIAAASTPATEAIRGADDAARELVEAVEAAYQFNREKVHQRAAEAGDAARLALQISNRLWWSFGVFALLIAIIYATYRWLALPEEQDA
jgi:hypothetical protein